MIPAMLAASAASTALGLLSAATESPAQPAKPNDQVNQADFMQLLITQLQHQDPLNPMDSANFSAQLAQFSSLQQLTEINQHLADQAGGSDTAGRFDALGILGKEARGAGDAVTIQDGVASGLDYTLAHTGVGQATVLDARGHRVAQLTLGTLEAGAHHLELTAVPGVPRLADGTYTVRLTVADGQGGAEAIPTLIGGRVTGVDLSGDAPVLLLGARRLALADVQEINEATAEPAA